MQHDMDGCRQWSLAEIPLTCPFRPLFVNILGIYEVLLGYVDADKSQAVGNLDKTRHFIVYYSLFIVVCTEVMTTHEGEAVSDSAAILDLDGISPLFCSG